MKRTPPSPAEQAPSEVPYDRDRLEIIRFATDEAQLQAISVLRDRGMLNLTSYRHDEWLVRTPVARKLREHGVPFEWLTEHV
jgi:hypothetical protein